MSTITREQLRERAREKVKSLEFAVTQTAFADIRTELEEDLELVRIALASLEADRYWVACSERMPEIGSTIMVHMDKPQHSATNYAIATYDKYGFSRAKVTHWQPLPSAPQQGVK